ncbi:hypothetical protein M2321_002286 [Rhodoblastus acidophilus]|uniref:hypothetical protein n=1 Tax=Rhodoblastus acidophilus TaxID=1074 RepID=UPI0018B0D90F|nr:hypothetical protein [Rhodoblastus acidophilus]MCW2274708.1 hypothetical protein [Rhodoblastus acidophilus]
MLAVAALVFLAPNLVFALQLNIAPALLLACGVLGAAVLTLRRPDGPTAVLDAPVDTRLLAICAALALALCVLGGEGHFFYSTTDWLIRDAVLADLTSNPSTAPVQSTLDGAHYFLRAPLGMYFLPASLGKLAGLTGAHYALLAQNSLLLAIVLYFAGVLGGGWRLVLLLIVINGMDILPVILTSPFASGEPVTGEPLYNSLLKMPRYALEHDNLEWWNGLLNYPSHVSHLFWAPNHALPGFFFAILCLLAALGEIDLAVLGVFFGALLLWSPLAALPAVAILPYFAWRAGLRGLAKPRLWVGAVCALCFAPVAVYLTLTSSSIPAQAVYVAEGFVLFYLVFLIVKIPHAFVLAWFRKSIAPEMTGLLAVSVAVLALLPFLNFGPSNDVVMRGSVAPLFILSFVFAKFAMDLPRKSAAGRLVLVIVGLGLITPLRDIQRALITPSYAISACNLITAAHQLGPGLSTNYLTPVSSAPPWLLRAPGADARVETVAVGAPWCWPGHPALRSPKVAEAGR